MLDVENITVVFSAMEAPEPRVIFKMELDPVPVTLAVLIMVGVNIMVGGPDVGDNPGIGIRMMYPSLRWVDIVNRAFIFETEPSV
jgi:hypothetical protein